jgi:hypothetical protein
MAEKSRCTEIFNIILMGRFMMAGRCLSVLLGAILSLVACANNDIVVDVLGLPSEANRLEVRVQLNGRDAKLLSIEPARDRFILNLPEGMVGSLSIQVVGIGATGCWESAGKGELDFQAGKRAPTYIQIEQRVSSLCPLEIRLRGEGHVRSNPKDPTWIDCTAEICRAMLPRESTINLTASPDLKGYLLTWAGDCSGTVAECQLSVSSAKTVTVDFYPIPCNKADGCWSGQSPTMQSWTGFRALWAAPTGDALAVDSNSVWRNQKGTWSQDKKTMQGTANAVWGTDAENVWLVGSKGRIAKLSTPPGTWQDVSPSAVSAPDLLGIWGTDASNLWVVGTKGTVLRGDGTSWSAADTGTTFPSVDLRGIWGTDPGTVWVVGGGGVVLNRTAGKWSATVLDPGAELRAIWGRDANHIWAVGDRGEPGGTAARGGVAYFFDGSKWSLQPLSPNPPLTSIWGSGVRDVWAVGIRGTISHYDGAKWQAVPASIGTPDLIGISGSACNNIWAISSGGVFQYAPR